MLESYADPWRFSNKERIKGLGSAKFLWKG